jgi:ABC-type Na+ transport system ATPase subunit NatA
MPQDTLEISLHFSVKAGEVFGLLGHNGAGKTTTMRIIVAEEAATAGRIRIGSRDIVSNQSEAFQVGPKLKLSKYINRDLAECLDMNKDAVYIPLSRGL